MNETRDIVHRFDSKITARSQGFLWHTHDRHRRDCLWCVMSSLLEGAFVIWLLRLDALQAKILANALCDKRLTYYMDKKHHAYIYQRSSLAVYFDLIPSRKPQAKWNMASHTSISTVVQTNPRGVCSMLVSVSAKIDKMITLKHTHKHLSEKK